VKVGRGLKAVTSNHDSIAEQYKDAFSKLKSNFMQDVSIGAAITVYRTWTLVQEIRKKLYIISHFHL
jgi:hypothetical protein